MMKINNLLINIGMSNIEKEKEYIKKIQQCQRNWDYSKEIPQEHIDYLLWVAQNAPSKQHEAYYDIYYAKDRKVIKELYNYTWGCTHSGRFNNKPPATWRNPQMNANLYILFVIKDPPTSQNSMNDGSPAPKNFGPRWENGICSVGIALGLVMRAAAELGYATGCNKSNSMGPDCDFYWERKLGIFDDVINEKKKMLYGVGIGYPQKNKPRNESDDYELAIGSANGHNLTFHREDRDIRGWRFRKVKIVDIRASNKAKDPYGNIHDLPEKPIILTNTQHKREIKCIEIK
jgi:nitroreductase